MALEISRVCEDLIAIKDQFDDNGDLIDAILEDDKAEELLIALGMAIAYQVGAITLNKTGEKHLKLSLQELDHIMECIGEEES
jgi:hypothetical protein